jgi:hypothetical protein
MGHTVDGSVSLSGDTVTADVTDVFDLTTGEAGSAHLTGSATVTDTLVDGSATLVLAFTAGAEAHDITITADWNGVDLEGCGGELPKGGTLIVTGNGTIGTTTINATRTITFGPACGEATID